jgi:hypothetical protein
MAAHERLGLRAQGERCSSVGPFVRKLSIAVHAALCATVLGGCSTGVNPDNLTDKDRQEMDRLVEEGERRQEQLYRFRVDELERKVKKMEGQGGDND